jgi:O-antigen ligase
VKTKNVLQRAAAYLVYGIVATIPLIFGAVHPIVLGVYVFAIFTGLGGWILLCHPKGTIQPPTFFTAVPLFLAAYLLLQSVPIPLDWLELLSPHRAARVQMVNVLAGTDLRHISLSENGPVGLYRFFFLIAAMLYYFSVKRLIVGIHNFQEILVFCLVGVGTFEAIYGLIQFINPHIGILWLSNPQRAAHGTIIYKNQYASLLNMIWPLAFASGICCYIGKRQKYFHDGIRHRMKGHIEELSTTKIQAPLMIFAAGTMILATLFSLSRGGILVMILVALMLVIVLPFSKTAKIGTMTVFVCLIAAYGAMLGWNTLVSRFDSLDDSGSQRLDIYLLSLPMLTDHWLTGIGIGSYELLSPLYLKGFPANIIYDSVHNEYLELAIELGLPAAALFFAWILAGMMKLMTGLILMQKIRNLDLDRRVIGAAAFCGLCGLLVHGLVDFGWRLPVNVIYCSTLLAICVCSLQQPRTQQEIVSEDKGGVPAI